VSSSPLVLSTATGQRTEPTTAAADLLHHQPTSSPRPNQSLQWQPEHGGAHRLRFVRLLPPQQLPLKATREEERRPRTDLKREEKGESTSCCDFATFAGHRRRGKETERKPLQTPLLCLDFPAAAREPTRHHCSGGAKGLPCNSRLFWGYFCNFWFV